MDSQLKPTVASEIVVPTKMVELRSLKTVHGAPVVVCCERRDELFISEMFLLPGARPSEGDSPSKEPVRGSEDQRLAEAKRLLAVAPGLIHSATSFVDTSGMAVRPAFHCDEASAVPGSFPWAMVALEDKLRVIVGCLEVSGFGGAADVEFPG